jgi:hypothetical protein
MGGDVGIGGSATIAGSILTIVQDVADLIQNPSSISVFKIG